MFQFDLAPPLALYIHFPWCVRKCPYCDFNSHPLRAQPHEHAYIDALLADLDQELPLVWGRPLHSIFMGGGTPSLFSPEALGRLVDALRARFNFAPDTEITMEANPGTVEYRRYREYRQAGINRLSIGVQSFDDDQLEKLGRVHRGGEAMRAAEAAHDAGFVSFNLDLMHGLPGQSAAQARRDLANAIDLQPPHLSYYQLTIEPNTWYARHPPQLPDADTCWSIHSQGQQLLHERGYEQYEVSAYSRPGHPCRHNLNYWQFGDYLGIGAGAHGKITDVGARRISRRWKVKHPQTYLARAGGEGRLGGEQALERADAILEFMMNALRLRTGFETALFQAHTGLPISAARTPLQQGEQNGWLIWERDRIHPTDQGYLYLNDLLGLFVPEA